MRQLAGVVKHTLSCLPIATVCWQELQRVGKIIEMSVTGLNAEELVAILGQ